MVFSYLSKNPNIKIEDVLENLDYDWDWYYVSQKPLTMKQIIDNPNLEWRIEKFSNQNFDIDREKFYEKEYRKYMCRVKIKIWLDSILLSPKFKWGRKHIERKIEDLYK